jgi:hypothetical protein
MESTYLPTGQELQFRQNLRILFQAVAHTEGTPVDELSKDQDSLHSLDPYSPYYSHRNSATDDGLSPTPPDQDSSYTTTSRTSYTVKRGYQQEIPKSNDTTPRKRPKSAQTGEKKVQKSVSSSKSYELVRHDPVMHRLHCIKTMILRELGKKRMTLEQATASAMEKLYYPKKATLFLLNDEQLLETERMVKAWLKEKYEA